jgi:hypothetical protein
MATLIERMAFANKRMAKSCDKTPVKKYFASSPFAVFAFSEFRPARKMHQGLDNVGS